MNRRDLFGGWYMGWIARSPYLGALLVYAVLAVPVYFFGREVLPLKDKDFGEWTALVRFTFTLAAVLWVAFTMNLLAKRLRDSGLPGWALTGLIFFAAFAVMRFGFWEQPAFLDAQDPIEGLRAFSLTEAMFPVKWEGVMWAGVVHAGALAVAAVFPTDFFPWVVDRDRWAVFD